MKEGLTQSPYLARFESFEVNLRSGELSKNGESIRLREQSFHVLAMLLERPGEVITRQEIQQRLWPNDTVVEFENSINAAIRRLRIALGDSAEEPRYIETLARRGYRFKPSVEWTVPLPREAHAPAPPPAVVRAPVDSPVSRLIGKIVSHYRVLEILGDGGMGVVYQAEDLTLGRRVAMKFLPEELGGDSKARERFEREARAVSSLSHPNVCAIHEFDEHEGQPFIVMELLHGKTLREHLAAGAFRLTAPPGLNIALQIARGLEAAHEKGIIHRDIKPTNIFVTEKNVAKILDFGVAKVLVAGQAPELAAATDREGISSKPVASNLTRTGLTPGTAGYMSPEQIRGEPLDAGTDIFSFGLVLYEMATGERAFRGETEAKQQGSVLEDNPRPVRELTPAISPELEAVIARCLKKARHERYRNGSELHQALLQIERGELASRAEKRASPGTRRWILSSLMVMAFGLGITGVYWRFHRTLKLTDRDTIVLSDFTNTTGDPDFDLTLKQGLSVQLEQSPFLKLLSASKVTGTLKLMGRQRGDSVTPDVAREICQRTGSKATLAGSIATLGRRYVIGLKAVDCQTGDTLAEAQQQASSKEAVLEALDAASAAMRGRLGESLNSVKRYATPLAEATTPSLEALNAYSLGTKTFFTKGSTAALPFLQRAVELDRNFALAYQALSTAYRNLGEVSRAAENGRKAFELREKVSEPERFGIESNYYYNTTGELEKAARVYELWQRTYPRDVVPYENLGVVFFVLGNHEKALDEFKEAMRLEPDQAVNYTSLGGGYLNLNRLEEAEAVFKQAEERKLEDEYLTANEYLLAWFKGDAGQVQKMAATAMGKPGTQDFLFSLQADTEAWQGKLERARELTRQAMDSARHNDAKESAAMYQAAAGLREVESGNRDQARSDVNAALKLAPNRDVRAIAALALARAGDRRAAETLAAELDKAYPLNTLVQSYWLPAIRAALALERKDPRRAVELLQISSTIDLGSPTGLNVSLCPVYLRGEAYLMQHDGNAAAAEFQKFIDHWGLVANFQWGALARLGLARAYAIQGDTARARAAYQDFLTLWKDADPDVPILKQAKTEYARLKNQS